MRRTPVVLFTLVSCLLPAHAFAISRMWIGGSGSAWSQPNSWSPAGTPDPSDSLTFPADVTMNNDLPAGTTVGPLTFNGSATLNGNALTLSGDVTAAGPLVVNTDLKLGNSLAFNVVSGSTFHGAMDVNGKTLSLFTSLWFDTLNGMGTINNGGLWIFVNGSGTFAGTIKGSVSLLNGSLPGATIPAGYGPLAGMGTIGDVSVGTITPGPWIASGYLYDTHSTGVLHTKSLKVAPQPVTNGSTTGVYVDLTPDRYDQIDVTGTVDISGAALHITLPQGLPSVGQTSTIINNDGTDPVNGTFVGLPEGATVTVQGVKFAISYHGGDGNDVTLTVIPSIKQWTGSVGSAWSEPNNWTPAGVPGSSDSLVFPAGATMVNDLTGFTAGPMTFNGSATLSGNPLTLSGDVWIADRSVFTCNADLTLAKNIKFPGTGSVTLNGALHVNGYVLGLYGAKTYMQAVNGSGIIANAGVGPQLHVAGSGTFSGTIDSILFSLDGGSLPNASVIDDLYGHGTVGDVTITGALGLTGVLHTKSVAVTSKFAAFGVHLTPGGSSDQLQVTGSVTLAGTLNVSFPGALPTSGQSFTIIDNDGSDPVSGTFEGLPEGATVTTVSGARMTISYQGGDGNDVTLTAPAGASTALVQSAADSVPGQSYTLTATVTAASGTPTGTVSFTDGSTITYGTAPLQNGVAMLTLTPRGAGTQNLVATYLGDSSFLPAASTPILHTIHRGSTATSVALVAGTAVYGSTRFDTLTTAVAPAAGDPGGLVTIFVDRPWLGLPLTGGQELSQGRGSVPVATLSPGSHVITAVYGGSNDFESSQSPSMTVTVAKAPAPLGVSTAHNPSPAGAPVSLTISAPAPTGVFAATGTVTVTENGVFLAQQTIVGTAYVVLHPGSGHHSFVISYSGDDDYLPSSANFALDVVAPMLTADSTRVFEGDAGTEDVEIPVRLSAASSDPISVPWHTADGTAHANVDYQQASGTIDFAPGETYHTVIVRVIGNTKKEDDKTFSVVFDAAANVQIATTSATVTIANDDDGNVAPPTRHRGVRH